MRISMLSMGSVGDVRPYILLAKELVFRGHQVTIAAFPQFREMVTEAGLPFFPLGGSSEALINAIMQPDTSGLTYLPRLTRSIKSNLPDLIRSLTESCEGADAMICNYFGTVYYSIAELFRIPCIQINFFPMEPTHDMPISSIRNQHLGKHLNLTTYKVGYLLLSSFEKILLSAWREEYHLDRRKIDIKPDYKAGTRSVLLIYAMSPALLSRPKEWNEQIHMTGFFFDHSPSIYHPSEELVHFLENGKKPVYIGFGSMNAGNMRKFISVILRAVRATGIRAVINLANTGRKLPSNQTVFFTYGYIPHDWLFPRVCAVIHHGGAGTTSAGLRYGKPTLVIPFAGDQPFWGNLVYQSGCGPMPISRKRLTVSKLSAGIIDLVTKERYKKNAEAMKKKMETENGIQNAADLIEKEITAG